MSKADISTLSKRKMDLSSFGRQSAIILVKSWRLPQSLLSTSNSQQLCEQSISYRSSCAALRSRLSTLYSNEKQLCCSSTFPLRFSLRLSLLLTFCLPIPFRFALLFLTLLLPLPFRRHHLSIRHKHQPPTEASTKYPQQ